LHERCVGGIVRIPEESHPRDLGDGLLEQLELFPDQVGLHVGDPGDVSARAREAGDESQRHRIGDRRHDDGDRLGRLLCRLDRVRTSGHKDFHLEPDQISREGGEPLVLPLRPSELDGNCLTFHIAQLTQALPEGLDERRDSWVRKGGREKKSYAGKARCLLGLAGERYHEDGDSEKHDENPNRRGGGHRPGASLDLAPAPGSLQR
jgi:hypothetical protein